MRPGFGPAAELPTASPARRRHGGCSSPLGSLNVIGGNRRAAQASARVTGRTAYTKDVGRTKGRVSSPESNDAALAVGKTFHIADSWLPHAVCFGFNVGEVSFRLLNVMKINAATIRDELHQLVDEGIELLLSFSPDQIAAANEDRKKPFKKVDFKIGYQDWYTKSLAVIEALLPNRVADFRSLYQPDRRKSVDIETYGIADYLVGLSLVQHKSAELAYAKLTQQLQIVQSCFSKLDSALLNLRQLVHADFLDSELDEARILAKSGYLRAAGALAGVALEKHLGLVASVRKIALKKKEPTIADLNDALKAGEVYDVPTWRFVSRLADIRNLCDHSKQREPTTDEVAELVAGVDKIAKSVA